MGKTLILNASPRADGDVAALLDAVKAELRGPVEELRLFRARLSPCVDCRRRDAEQRPFKPYAVICQNIAEHAAIIPAPVKVQVPFLLQNCIRSFLLCSRQSRCRYLPPLYKSLP